MAAVPAGPLLANGLQPLSCLRCAHRKVRCDRVVPCSNCIRHSALCEFPQPKTEKRQRRKVGASSPTSRNNKTRPRIDRYREVLESLRVDVVESIAGSLQGTLADSPLRDQTPPPEPVDTAADAAGGAPGGRLVVVGKRSRYIEGELWARIGTELDAGAMFPDSSSSDEEDEYGEEGVSGARTGYKASGLALRIPPETPSTKGLYPTQHHFRQLWPIYLANIHPVTMILHAPSASEILAEAAKGHGHASKDVEALLFATMGCALNSVTEAECARLLGEKKSILLAKYRRGCEVALANANFLMSSNLCVLQAYTIYLVAIGPHVDPCELWNLSGIAMRNAQRLGLHQEIATAGLTPFEVEMRRRLWFQIVMHDAISAQGVGLQRPEPSCNITAPSNVNDADLSPSMKEPPKERVGATDMIFCNLRHKVMKFMGQVNGGKRPWASALGEKWTPAVDQRYRAEREKAVAEMENELELELLRYCDMLNPVHFFTVIVARLTLCNLRYIMLQPCHSGKNGPDCTEKDRESMFSAALKVLEYENNANRQPSIQGFLWHAHQYFSWSCLIHILEDLKTRPWGEQVDKTWEQIRMFYDVRPNLHQSPNCRLPLYSGINKMVVEAWQIREIRASERGQTLVFPTYITALREQEYRTKPTGQAHKVLRQSPSTISASQTLRDQAPNQGLPSVSSSLGQESASWPNWAAFATTASNPSGDDMNFLDPSLDQEISMSIDGHSSRIYQSHILMPPLDQYGSGGGGW